MNASQQLTVHEPARRVPVVAEADVLVVGGGPAGIAAAACAARHGASTLLIERYGFLGGMGTAGGVTNFAGLYGKRDGDTVQLVHGVVDELLERIERLGGLNAPQDGLQGRIRVRSYDIPAYKCAADQLLLAAGVRMLLHALLVGALCDEAGYLQAAIVETKSGRGAIRARWFVDASGDADLAHHSGVPYELGDGHGDALYPSTMFRVGAVDADRALAAVGSFGAIDALMRAAAGRYRFPREGAILRPQRNRSEWRVNVTQVANAQGRAVDATDAAQLSAGEVEGRRQVIEYLRFLRAEVPGFERCELIDIGTQLGVRETRRVKGAYQLSGEDVQGGARFDDSIGLNAWPIERHSAGRVEWAFARDQRNTWNQLPWRMLVPQSVGNLLVAGRCASMEHEGQSAARASGACFVMGQAAGTAAALMATGGVAAHEVIHPLQQRLRRDGVDLGHDA
ncbi:MAG TPA: FAD-dependent oxidoreductase [Burkholderiaceae bacterium]